MDPQHTQTVHRISTQVQSFSSTKTPFHIYHGTTSSTRKAHYNRLNTIDTSSLNRVLRITNTPTKKTALVEPNVSMDVLVQSTLREGLVPLVVMEFPGITVGGGFAGTSGESSSFRYGFFDRTICWIEMVLADGGVVEAYPPSYSSRGEVGRDEREDGEGEGEGGKNADLFYGAVSSFGTLGITTCLEVKLRDAKLFVELRYFPIASTEEMVQKMKEVERDERYEYLDGILFAKDRGVVCAGFLSDGNSPSSSTSSASTSTTKQTQKEEGEREREGEGEGEDSTLPIRHFTRPYDPWFYIHAEDVLKNHPSSSSQSNKPHTDLIPIKDYLFRYDRGAFWGGKYSFDYFLMPFTPLTRRILDAFMHTRVMYHALHKSGLAKRYIIQDVGIPAGKLDEFVEYLDDTFGKYPLWMCPLKEDGVGVGSRKGDGYGYGPILAERCSDGVGIRSSTSTSTPMKEKEEKEREREQDNNPGVEFINVGIWGPSPSRPGESFKTYNRALEQKVHSLGGQKCLYAHTYYTEQEFWEIYDRDACGKLREKYHAEYLPDLWQKVRVKDQYENQYGRGVKGWGVGRGVWGWVKEIWPLRGVYGVLSVVFGGKEYLL